MATAASARAAEDHRKHVSDEERRNFEEKFNKLIDALQGFTQEYNRSNGAVWPAKKVEAVNHALRDLERTKSWRGNKKKSSDHPEADEADVDGSIISSTKPAHR